MKKRILYANANYEEIVAENGYFVDKTHYIEKLEKIGNPVFLRPRRFGKSLLCRILECYYNINQANDFDRLFGQTWIGAHPTPLRNSFFVLHLDFSVVDSSGSISDIEKNFNHIVGKFHEKFAGKRIVIEFKYYSNAAFGKMGETIENFTLKEEDLRQIAGYVEGLRREYPEADISQYVIYCFGNQGFRVFSVDSERKPTAP